MLTIIHWQLDWQLHCNNYQFINYSNYNDNYYQSETSINYKALNPRPVLRVPEDHLHSAKGGAVETGCSEIYMMIYTICYIILPQSTAPPIHCTPLCRVSRPASLLYGICRYKYKHTRHIHTDITTITNTQQYIDMHAYMCVYIYIYIERERERDREI